MINRIRPPRASQIEIDGSNDYEGISVTIPSPAPVVTVTPLPTIPPVYEDITIIRAPIGHNHIYRSDDSGESWDTTYMDTTTFIAEDGTVMISIRFLTYAMQAQLHWNQATATASLLVDGTVVRATVGSAMLRVGGEEYLMLNNSLMPAPVYLRAEHNRMFIPMSAIGLAFGVDYRFDGDSQEAVFYLTR